MAAAWRPWVAPCVGFGLRTFTLRTGHLCRCDLFRGSGRSDSTQKLDSTGDLRRRGGAANARRTDEEAADLAGAARTREADERSSDLAAAAAIVAAAEEMGFFPVRFFFFLIKTYKYILY